MHYPRDASAPGEVASGFQDAYEVGTGRGAVSGSDGFIQSGAGSRRPCGIEHSEAVGHGDAAGVENVYFEAWKLSRGEICRVHRRAVRPAVL